MVDSKVASIVAPVDGAILAARGGKRLVVLDVGNTHVVVGIFRGDRLERTYRLAADPTRTADDFRAAVLGLLAADGGPSAVAGIVGGSVVPALVGPLAAACAAIWGQEPLWVGGGVDLGMPLRVDRPLEVGADRLANAVAVRARHPWPVIAIDFGTATKIDVVNGRGEYMGGVIAPGIATAAEALARRGAKLPAIPLVLPQSVIGRNTQHAMQAGVVAGHAAMVGGLLHRVQEELGQAARIVATGGLAAVVVAGIEGIYGVEPDLTLQGLRLVHERRRAQ